MRSITFGQRMREARLAASLSQTELSERSGISKPTLSRYENDHVAPSLATLARLAEALGVPEGTLLATNSSPIDVFIAELHAHGIDFRSASEARQAAQRCADLLAPAAKRQSSTG